ncbi:hypothetical protein [Dyadobacter sp. LHD-138]|uniref:hypothetical protein n=1 Tax=Dyadobacter sp. LHD-138 TaxID=3071413 RepID=UPI0027E05C4B|nr:hypothetical protein [Dyadobacter sp. LHD-138]MDQ6477152.1 hypothetical protein [Dyadobacter sp. LHD-138]
MKIYQFILFFVMILTGGCIRIKPDQASQNQQALAVLRHVMATQSEWVKVHAAEYLIWSGNPQGVQERFLLEDKLYGSKPQYRIGIWRVLAQLAATAGERKVWTDKIKAAFLDPAGTDRLHAAETLAKLRISPLHDNQLLTEETLKSEVKPLALYTFWSVCFTSQDSQQAAPGQFLEMIQQAGKDAVQKTIPAYAMRQLKGLSEPQWQRFSKIALAEPTGSSARIYLLSAAFSTADTKDFPPLLTALHSELIKYKDAPSKGERTEMTAALAENGTSADLPLLLSLFKNENPFGNETDSEDVRAAAAYAILKINQRSR